MPDMSKRLVALVFSAAASLTALSSAASGAVTGDVNGDGAIDLLDVAPFVDLIISGDFQAEADINSDGAVDLLDIAPFVQLLTNPGPPAIVPLFDENTSLEPETTIVTDEALITRVGDRGRDRHAREDQFQAYDHYLSFYWEQRTVSIEIVDRIALGGNGITVNIETLIPLTTRDFRAFFRGITTEAEYWLSLIHI